MKILHLLCFPLYGSGSGSYARKLCEQLVKNGHSVAIVCPDKRPIKGVKIFTVPLPFTAVFTGHPEWPDSPLYSDLSGLQLNRLQEVFSQVTLESIETFNPDIIHVHHTFSLTWIASYVKSFYSIPYVVTAHGSDIHHTTLDSRYLTLTKQALQRAEYIVCVSNHVKKWLLKVYGQKLKPKTRIIAGGVDLSPYIDLVTKTNIDRKYHLNGQPLILYVGKLTMVKGLEYLVRAAENIHGIVYIIGEGPDRARLEKIVTERKIKNVRFLGYFGKNEANELRAFYQRATVLVVPSIWEEALGLVIIEAMAAKTPVIASKKGGIPLAVKHGQTGFLIRARSAKAITQSVNSLIQNPELQAKLGQKARTLVFERFTWEYLTRNIEQIYQYTYQISQKLKARKNKTILDPSNIARLRKEVKSIIGSPTTL